MILPHTPRKDPKIWHPKPTRQYLSFDILHDYLSKTMLFFCTWWPFPTPSEGPQNMKSETYSSRPFIWYTTWLPLKNFEFFALMTLSHPLGRAPQYEIRNLLVKSFHLINYMTTFKTTLIVALDDLVTPPWKGLKIWNPKPTCQDLSFDILHDYLSKTFFFLAFDDLAPPPSENY